MVFPSRNSINCKYAYKILLFNGNFKELRENLTKLRKNRSKKKPQNLLLIKKGNPQSRTKY